MAVHLDPIRGMLNCTRGKGYALVDLLTQSISLCIGFWFLDKEAIRSLHSSNLQEEFEQAVYDHIKRVDPNTAQSFRAFSQVRLLQDTFQELFCYWEQFSGDKNRLCHLTERLIHPHLSRVYRNDLAVPSWLERFAMELLPIASGTFYDGTAGAGGMAIKIAQYGAEKERPIQIVTREVDPLLFHLSVLRAKMHGFVFQQSNEDCLYAQRNFPAVEADMSIMFPPLHGGNTLLVAKDHLCGSDWSYAYHQMETLKMGGVGVCRIPNGALFNVKNRPFRNYLLSLNVLDAIIALPKNTPFPAAPATSLVVFRKGRKKDDAVRIMELPTPEDSGRKKDSGSVPYLFRKSLLPIAQENSVLLAPSDLDASNLSPQMYLPDLQRKSSMPQSLPNIPADQTHSTVKRLKDVAIVYRGLNIAGLVRQEDGRQVLRLSDVQNGRICMDEVVRYDLSKRGNLERYRIQAGDILISCKGKAIKLCAVSENVPLLLSHDFLGIRADSSKIDPRYLFYFLKSPAGQSAIQQIQMGSSIPMIRATDLERLPLHYIPLALQTQCAEELQKTDLRLEEQMAALNVLRQQAYAQFYKKTGLGDAL